MVDTWTDTIICNKAVYSVFNANSSTIYSFTVDKYCIKRITEAKAQNVCIYLNNHNKITNSGKIIL